MAGPRRADAERTSIVVVIGYRTTNDTSDIALLQPLLSWS